MSEHSLPTVTGYRRPGWIKVAEFDDVVTELKVRRGKLTAKVGDVWHIVPTPPPSTPIEQ